MFRCSTIVGLSTLCALAALPACGVSDNPDDPTAGEELADDVEDSDGAEEPEDSDGADDDDQDDADPDAPPPGRLPPQLPAVQEGECENQFAESACGIDGQVGVQYCDTNAGWGPCLLDAECTPGETRLEDCPGSPNTELGCALYGGVPEWDQCGFTPLVLSFDNQEPVFGDSLETFELSAGTNECIASRWPSASTPWLAIDLDGSGAIENGRELFGSASPTADGHRPENGFEALAEYDANDDGQITELDPVWPKLLVWTDRDQDRRSSAWELAPLSHSGLDAIELRFVRDRRCDDQRACGIERAAFSFDDHRGALRHGTVIDVHVPCN